MPLFDKMPQYSWQHLYQVIESKTQCFTTECLNQQEPVKGCDKAWMGNINIGWLSPRIRGLYRHQEPISLPVCLTQSLEELHSVTAGSNTRRAEGKITVGTIELGYVLLFLS